MASTTSSVSTGLVSARIARTSSISAWSIESRPAVSRMTTSKPSRRPASMARRAICTGVSPLTIGSEATSARSANCANCNWAAGRWVSRLASRTRFFSRVRRRSASLPEVVVLPDPCRPTISTGIGAGAFRFSGTAPAPPSASTSASLTILATVWPGETDSSTSAPTARSRTRATKSFTTGSATSASSMARRTSRRASPTSASVSAPRLRSPSKMPVNLSDRESNMVALLQCTSRRCANTRGAAEPPHQAGTGKAGFPERAGLSGMCAGRSRRKARALPWTRWGLRPQTPSL